MHWNDESHLTQDHDMQYDKFLKRHGLADVTATGDLCTLEATDTYYVSVSATPYSELSSIAHSQVDKHVERLAPGDGYVGIQVQVPLWRTKHSHFRASEENGMKNVDKGM